MVAPCSGRDYPRELENHSRRRRHDGAARRPTRIRPDRVAHRAQRRSRRPRPHHQPRLHRSAGVRRDVRQAVRRHAGPEDRPAARHRVRVGGRPSLGRDQAAPRGQVPRRAAVQRRGGAVQHRPASHHHGLVPQVRDQRHQERGRHQRPHPAAEPLPALGAAARRADGSLGHDGVAQGGEGAGGQVRDATGLRRALSVRRRSPASRSWATSSSRSTSTTARRARR